MRRTVLVLLSLVLSALGLAAVPALQAASARATIPWPSDNIGDVVAKPGPGPGEVTFTWKTEGKNTDYFRIDTATSPFGSGARDHAVFKIPAKARKYTLTKKQTAKANAGIGSGWTLIWRFRAVNETRSGKQERYFGQGQSRVLGQAPQGQGSDLRVASYNVRGEPSGALGKGEKPWAVRAPLVLAQIADEKAGIVLVQELFPSQMDTFREKLALFNAAGNGAYDYRLTRTAGVGAQYMKLQTRFLYDATRYAQVDQCPGDDNTNYDCLIRWQNDNGKDHAAVNRFQDIASGQQFVVASFHLTSGDKSEAMRTQGMRDILDGIDAFNPNNDPVIVGGDSNSSQLRDGVRPHDVLMSRGYYDTASTVNMVNGEYGTANDFETQKPSPIGVSSRIDLIATKRMPGSAKFKNCVVPRNATFPSDHNMIVTDLKLP